MSRVFCGFSLHATFSINLFAFLSPRLWNCFLISSCSHSISFFLSFFLPLSLSIHFFPPPFYLSPVDSASSVCHPRDICCPTQGPCPFRHRSQKQHHGFRGFGRSRICFRGPAVSRCRRRRECRGGSARCSQQRRRELSRDLRTRAPATRPRGQRERSQRTKAVPMGSFAHFWYRASPQLVVP